MLDYETANRLFAYAPDTGIVTRKVNIAHQKYAKAGQVVGTLANGGYLHVQYSPHLYRLHRLIWLLYYGEWPKHEIDHQNGVRTDNRIENLRDVTRIENMKNHKISSLNKTGVIGVFWHSSHKRWVAKVFSGKKCIFLYRGLDFFEAVCARKTAEIEYNFHPNHGRVR